MITSARLKILTQVLFWPVFFLIGYCNYLIFLVVPNEKVMGPVQRVFYFHVGAATASYVAIAIVLIGSVMYLAGRDWRSDVIAEAAGEVSLLFCTIVLISGMIWGHVAWGAWFLWSEPRLVSFLLLWLIFLAYNVLRRFAGTVNVASFCAVLGIVGSLNVPIVVYSIKLLPQTAQIHPQIVENNGLKDPLFLSTMFWGIGALVPLCILLIVLRARIAILERESHG